MKMYQINPNGYGQVYFVMAKSNEDALKAVVQSKEYEADLFKDSTIDNLPKGYSIVEYTEMVVASVEIS